MMPSDRRRSPLAALLLLLLFVSAASPDPAAAQVGLLPEEPVEIGTTPQFLLDGYIVDNHFALKYKREAVVRRFHPPAKFAGNPVIAGEGGYPAVVRDAQDGTFRMWYQTSVPRFAADGERRGSRYAIAYAESPDGIHWKRPKLGLIEWKGTKENNVVWRGITGDRSSGPCILDLPPKDRRGFRYELAYRTSGAGREYSGIRIVGSNDGIHWDKSSDRRIAHLHSDTLNSIVYDPRGKEYLMFCRAKHIYRTFRGAIIDTGASRRVARMSSKTLWDEWESQPQNILIPDELDAARDFNFYYGMPVHYHAGIFWGFLWTFKMNTEIVPELAFSRDGVNFHRLPGNPETLKRPRLIDLGEEGAWDDGMVLTGTGWVEVGDEWRIYYSGWDGPHGGPEKRIPGIGFARCPRERLISLRGPRGGGVIITRQIKWPGGKLFVNAAAADGELKVRVSDANRKVLPGFDYADCVPLTADSLSHEVQWQQPTIQSLAGQTIRLEFYLRDADLFTFRAGEPSR